MKKIIDATHIPDLSDEGIHDWYSYQPKSDYRKLVKIERLVDQYAVRLTLEGEL